MPSINRERKVVVLTFMGHPVCHRKSAHDHHPAQDRQMPIRRYAVMLHVACARLQWEKLERFDREYRKRREPRTPAYPSYELLAEKILQQKI
jgi:hypothetical protein